MGPGLTASLLPLLTPGFRGHYACDMEVNLTPDQKDFVRRAIESGRLSREEEAVKEALSLWEDRERKRLEILSALDEAEASLSNGEGREITPDSARELADSVKRLGRARLASQEHRS